MIVKCISHVKDNLLHEVMSAPNLRDSDLATIYERGVQTPLTRAEGIVIVYHWLVIILLRKMVFLLIVIMKDLLWIDEVLIHFCKYRY